MKLLVCISKAPDTTAKIAFTDGDSKFDENGVQYIVNPYDEWYALVRALELVEANGGSVTTITVGTAADDPTIRKALAIGANDAVRIDTEALESFLATRLAKFEIPSFVRQQSAPLPRSASGKILKRLLRLEASKELGSEIVSTYEGNT